MIRDNVNLERWKDSTFLLTKNEKNMRFFLSLLRLDLVIEIFKRKKSYWIILKKKYKAGVYESLECAFWIRVLQLMATKWALKTSRIRFFSVSVTHSPTHTKFHMSARENFHKYLWRQNEIFFATSMLSFHEKFRTFHSIYLIYSF